MTIEFIDIPSTYPLGTQDGISYMVYPEAMPLPDFTEKH